MRRETGGMSKWIKNELKINGNLTNLHHDYVVAMRNSYTICNLHAFFLCINRNVITIILTVGETGIVLQICVPSSTDETPTDFTTDDIVLHLNRHSLSSNVHNSTYHQMGFAEGRVRGASKRRIDYACGNVYLAKTSGWVEHKKHLKKNPYEPHLTVHSRSSSNNTHSIAHM